MWFVSDIAEKLEGIGDYFWDAYRDVKDWWSPFNELAYPLFYIAAGFYGLSSRFWAFDEWLDELVAEVASSLTLESVYLYFKEYLDMAADAWDWVDNAWWNVWNIIDAWWTSTMEEVQSWILSAQSVIQLQVNNLTTALANVQAMIDELVLNLPNVSEILAWFSNWRGYVLSVITVWWLGALSTISVLIASAFIERHSWWAGWQDFRDIVAEFFSDPLEFLWERFTDWFLGPEV